MCPSRNSFTRKGDNGELAIVDRIRRRAAGRTYPGVDLGIGDDCALIRTRPGEETAITTDLSIDGRHFSLKWHPAEAVGHRTLSRGLSDLAAMGARPIAAFLSLGLPRDLVKPEGRKPAWIHRFLDGFLALATQYAIPLAGGDLAESPIAVADIVVVGGVPRGKALLRSSARPGDFLYVTGALGGSAAGLNQLRKSLTRSAARFLRGTKDDPLAKHLRPQPRIDQGQWLLQKEAATAAIDLSDGISTDLNHLCIESGVAAEIEVAALPVFRGASLEQALHGGEDYELLFAARPDAPIPRSIGNVSVTRIGRTIKACPGQARITMVSPTGREELSRRGWEHFVGKVPPSRKARLSS